MATHSAEPYGLGEPLMLEKIDKLFACGVGELVDLPQIVVVGDQSSGKSSVLEGLIKKPLPRDSGLCTRFATQIVFRRANVERILVSIIPDRNASSEHSNRLKAWGKAVPSLDSKAFTNIMKEVHHEMGLSGDNDQGERKPTFSNDVLHLEISGPDQEHLSVINVPGIFKSTTAGVTTKADILLVRNMVKGYMDNPRSVMLAVIPSNVDVATQEILELAAEADVYGDRTLGVLTKPDLVDKGAESRVVDLVEGRARVMKLGWHMIRNPGQMELSDKSLSRGLLETEFFRSTAPWSSIDKEKVGVECLRGRLKEVLSSLVKREFPKVKAEIKSRLNSRRRRLSDLGPERKGAAEQMAHLTKLATRFQRIVSLALGANYGADDVFITDSALRIAPAVMARMKIFSDEMTTYGQAHSFLPQDGLSPPVKATTSSPDKKSFDIRKEDDLEALVDILHPQDSLPQPKTGEIKTWLLEVFQGNRGFELGTFNASILATAMKVQSSKWMDISLGHVSDVIVMVHRFITTALASICNDRDIRDAIINSIYEDLIRRYQKAANSTKFLLEVENSDTPMTLNHYFNDNLQKSRQGKIVANLKKHSFQDDYTGKGTLIPIDHAIQAHAMSNDEHIVHDIHDILKSYYKVSRKRFVDNVCQQATVHYLLTCDESPLALFSPIFVSQLSTAELEEIAGEAPGVKRTRAQLAKEIASLAEAMKILARA
ncbi:hypothetical protein LTR36_002379 [Oleoguttula mirabilis]|uniref:Dynamin GTPase n=1 Tax=Oleoguttula mirabilis TaxID=1507867 RepID=A0AAV9JLN8_9PEZI|nr:hypothetical protein LTR36_002379 [Oleoguttula mirabilis]